MTTHLTYDRDLALRVGYEATDWTTPIAFEDYANSVKDWTMQAIMRNGECIGAVFRHNDELHVSILPKWRKIWATKNLLRELFNAPRVTTRVTNGHDHMYDILARLGFKLQPDGLLVKEM